MAGHWHKGRLRSCDSDRERPGTLADFGYMSGELVLTDKKYLTYSGLGLIITSSVIKP